MPVRGERPCSGSTRRGGSGLILLYDFSYLGEASPDGGTYNCGWHKLLTGSLLPLSVSLVDVGACGRDVLSFSDLLRAGPQVLCGSLSVRRLSHSSRLSRHDRRDRVLVDELLLPVSNEQKRIAVEPCHEALEPNAPDQEDRDRHIVLAHVIQEGVLESLRVFCGHDRSSWKPHT